MVDVRNIYELSDALTQVLFFVEQINATGSYWINRRHREGKEPTPDLPDKESPQVPHLKNLILDLGREINSRNSLSSPIPDRSYSGPYPSEFASLASQVGLVPAFNAELIRALIPVLLRPAKVRLEANGKWMVEGRANLQRLPSPQRLFEEFYMYKSAEGYGLSTQRITTEQATPLGEARVIYWEEALDPVAVLRDFLINSLGENDESSDHYIQLWLKHQFDLPFEKRLKYILSAVHQRFNDVFFGKVAPQSFRSDKSATLSTSLFIDQIVRVLDSGVESTEASRKEALKRALGIYLFLRFCRQLRCRYYWLRDKPRLKGGGELQEEIFRSMKDGQCVSALRPLEYTYLQTRMFGALSFIPGFNFIFRGGFLPRTDSGRTLTVIGPPGAGKTVLALQMMTDLARVGRLALYLSFEESYDAIVDRLITFGLYDPSKFEVLSVGQDIESQIRERGPKINRKGLLLLYSISDYLNSRKGDEHDERAERPAYDLVDLINRVGDACGEEAWRWRALTIDSINALELASKSGEVNRRVDLQQLIEAIEVNRFLGVILSEKGDRDFAILPYLSDTVVELGSDQVSLTRWIEIKKCRNQDYQPGPHTFRIVDARGVIIYPSLSSRMSSLRRRVRSTLSERRMIPFPAEWEGSLGLGGIKEKSSTLIWGPAGTGKTLLLLHLATESGTLLPSKGDEPALEKSLDAPSNILLVTFRTSELNFLQTLREYEGLSRKWRRIKRTRVRWYSPGENLTGAEIVNDLWRYVRQSRREGVPLERLVFDEVEVAEKFLPTLQRESLFWSTILELSSTEAITSIFVSGAEDGKGKFIESVGSSMDYIFHLERVETKNRLTLQKSPLWIKERGDFVDFDSSVLI